MQDEHGLDLASLVKRLELDSMIFISTFQLEILFEFFLHTHMDKSMYAQRLDKDKCAWSKEYWILNLSRFCMFFFCKELVKEWPYFNLQ